MLNVMLTKKPHVLQNHSFMLWLAFQQILETQRARKTGEDTYSKLVLQKSNIQDLCSSRTNCHERILCVQEAEREVNGTIITACKGEIMHSVLHGEMCQ